MAAFVREAALQEARSVIAGAAAQLEACSAGADLCINSIAYAEVPVGFDRMEELDEAQPPSAFQRLDVPWEAGFLTGKVLLRYRRARGRRTSPLPEFHIGTRAAIEGMTLLTRVPGATAGTFRHWN